MSFDSRQEARAIVGETEFFDIDFGTHHEYYTTHRKSVTAFGRTWKPVAARRSGTTQDSTVKPKSVKLVMPINATFVDMAVRHGVDVTKLTIIRGFGYDYANDYRNPWFVGHLKSLLVGVVSAGATFEGVETLFEEPLSRIRHQAGCNNTVFDGTCSLAEIDYVTVRTVTSLSEGGRIVGFDGAVPVNDFYTLGRIRKVGGGDIYRFVLRQAGPQLVLQIPVPGLAVGDAFEMLPGCDGAESTCRLKYANKDNFVGMAKIPVTNPVLAGF